MAAPTEAVKRNTRLLSRPVLCACCPSASGARLPTANVATWWKPAGQLTALTIEKLPLLRHRLGFDDKHQKSRCGTSYQRDRVVVHRAGTAQVRSVFQKRCRWNDGNHVIRDSSGYGRDPMWIARPENQERCLSAFGRRVAVSRRSIMARLYANPAHPGAMDGLPIPHTNEALSLISPSSTYVTGICLAGSTDCGCLPASACPLTEL